MWRGRESKESRRHVRQKSNVTTDEQVNGKVTF
jgi:hypothetical protein